MPSLNHTTANSHACVRIVLNYNGHTIMRITFIYDELTVIDLIKLIACIVQEIPDASHCWKNILVENCVLAAATNSVWLKNKIVYRSIITSIFSLVALKVTTLEAVEVIACEITICIRWPAFKLQRRRLLWGKLNLLASAKCWTYSLNIYANIYDIF